jgi:ABC-2 type transport system ATP-binding protein
LIRASGFSKTYGGLEAVRDLTFHVGPGEILGLVGPNGAGKTTTIRALSGIISPTTGGLSIAGHDVTSEPLLAKQALGYVPDEPHLFDTLTVWEHLEFTAAAYHVDNYRPVAEALLRTFELQDKCHLFA